MPSFFLKGQQLEKHENLSWGACVYVLRCMVWGSKPLQIISKGSNNILSIRWGENERHLLSRVCEPVLTAGVPREWMSKHSAWRDASKCSHKMSDPPTTSPALVITFTFLSVSPCKRQPRLPFTLFSGRWMLPDWPGQFFAPLFSILALHISYFLYTSSSALPFTELNPAKSLIGITVHVQCLIHNAWLSLLLSFKS